mgnify:CR=1 FL=1
MSSLKELRKLAVLAPGYYATMADGSIIFASISGDKLPANLPKYEKLYYFDGSSLQEGDGKGWVSADPTAISTINASKITNLAAVQSNTSQPQPSNINKPAASKSTVVIKPELCGKQTKDAKYKYIIAADGKSFQWSGQDKSGTHKVGDKNWAVMVAALNKLPASKQSNDTYIKPEEPTPEAAKPAAAETTTPASTLDAGLVQKVEFILGRAMNYSLNVKSGHSEKAQISKLVSAVESTKKSGSGLNFLAQMIVASAPNAFQAIAGADLATLGKATMKDLAVHRNGAYSGDVGVILGKINEIAANYAKDPKTITGIKTAPAKAASKYPAKIIRLASLRRLRVRSEMEAAITSSAMPGRDRVS